MTNSDPPKTKPDRIEPTEQQIDEMFAQYGITNTLEFAEIIKVHIEHNGHSEYAQSEEFRKSIVRAFENAFIKEANGETIPESVDAALIDASHWICQTDIPDTKLDPEFEEVPSILIGAVGKLIPAYTKNGLYATAITIRDPREN
jgi:hypothetical protein